MEDHTRSVMGNLLNFGIDRHLGIGEYHPLNRRQAQLNDRRLWMEIRSHPGEFVFVAIDQNHMVSTTRNSASPLIMRA